MATVRGDSVMVLGSLNWHAPVVTFENFFGKGSAPN